MIRQKNETDTRLDDFSVINKQRTSPTDMKKKT